ncbi:hypothetical protein EPI10_022994 [Gossypium australe]|uniref:Secreted protein n=1 Tax=Gossypium australe TaxID=47621 RepID=A0A5B6VSW1_9ROSI|nr:hypothetical protein EPI10_022994 [Gossypium australe]
MIWVCILIQRSVCIWSLFSDVLVLTEETNWIYWVTQLQSNDLKLRCCWPFPLHVWKHELDAVIVNTKYYNFYTFDRINDL